MNYAVQGCAVLYMCTSLFRRNLQGKVFYLNPKVLPPRFFYAYIISFIMDIAWTRAFVGKDFLWSTVLCVVWLAFILFAMAHCCASYHKSTFFEDLKAVRWCDRIFVRLLFYNGLAVYAAETCIKFLQNIGVCIKYYYGAEAGIIPTYTFLSLLSIIMISATIMEIKLFDVHLRYVLGHHFVFVNTMIGILAVIYKVRGAVPDTEVVVFSSVVVTLALGLSLVKSGVTIVRHHKTFLFGQSGCTWLAASLFSLIADDTTESSS